MIRWSHRLRLLQPLHGKIILHKERLFKVFVAVEEKEELVEDTSFFHKMMGDEPTYKSETIKEVDEVWLIDMSESTMQISMPMDSFIKEVLNVEPNVLTVRHVNQFALKFFFLKRDFEKLYDMTPKEEVKENTRNI